MAGGQRTTASARIGSVDGGVGESIKSHGGRAGGEHRDDDPEKLMGSGKAGGGEHGSAKSEWKGKNGVLPFDHLERDAKVAESGHETIVKQLAVLSFRFSLPATRHLCT